MPSRSMSDPDADIGAGTSRLAAFAGQQALRCRVGRRSAGHYIGRLGLRRVLICECSGLLCLPCGGGGGVLLGVLGLAGGIRSGCGTSK